MSKSFESKLFDIAKECSTYNEYRIRCTVENLEPKSQYEFDLNKKGIILCPYIPCTKTVDNG